MGLIETYEIKEGGFQPVLVKDSWQVSALNYSADYDIDQLKCLVKHQQNDRAISLLGGEAVLIVSDDLESIDFRTITMARGTSYNVPQNVWYAIVMSKGSQLFIVESPDAQTDELQFQLTEEQISLLRQELYQKINPSE